MLKTLFAIVATTACGFTFAQTAKVDKILGTQQQTGSNDKSSQEVIDAAATETDNLLAEYRVALQKIANTRVYNNQVKQLLDSQKSEIESMNIQIVQVEQTSKEVVPLMIKMIDRLDQVIDSDLPFLRSERSARLLDLRAMLGRADVSTSEKYRRILEAYQIENEYGRTIEAYRDNLDVGGKSFAVDFLRMGRISLIYQTIDGMKSGYWDNSKKAWLELDSSYKKNIREGLRIARKQAVPELVEVPVPVAEVIQ